MSRNVNQTSPILGVGCKKCVALHPRRRFFCNKKTNAQEKEDWINAVGRAIVKHSRRCAIMGLQPALGHVHGMSCCVCTGVVSRSIRSKHIACSRVGSQDTRMVQRWLHL